MILRFDRFQFDYENRRLAGASGPIPLNPKAFDVLRVLLQHAGRLVSKDDLLDAVWGYEHYPSTRTVDTHIVHLRQKLEKNPEDPRFILTIHGAGYKFVGL